MCIFEGAKHCLYRVACIIHSLLYFFVSSLFLLPPPTPSLLAKPGILNPNPFHALGATWLGLADTVRRWWSEIFLSPLILFGFKISKHRIGQECLLSTSVKLYPPKDVALVEKLRKPFSVWLLLIPCAFTTLSSQHLLFFFDCH